MATVNGIMADHKINVEAQLLGTRGEFGYVLTDISAAYTEEMLEQLRALPDSAPPAAVSDQGHCRGGDGLSDLKTGVRRTICKAFVPCGAVNARFPVA